MKVMKIYLKSTPFYKRGKRFMWYCKIGPSKFIKFFFEHAFFCKYVKIRNQDRGYL